MQGRRILLVIGGGIAAYKSLDLIRRLRQRNASVRCILTAGAQHFVTPLAAGALSGQRAHTDLFDGEDEADIGHIKLARDADAIVVAPATANLMSKMASGAADDLASTVLLATALPILIAPAMNVRMWQHPATQRNLATLRDDGIHVVGPNDGAMAEAEFGPGRMAEPIEIADAAAKLLSDVPHAEVPERSVGLQARTQGAASFEARLRLAPQQEERCAALRLSGRAAERPDCQPLPARGRGTPLIPARRRSRPRARGRIARRWRRRSGAGR